MARDKNKTIVATIREYLRDYYFHWLWFKAVKIFGNHLHKTVRLSRTTGLDKAYPGGCILMNIPIWLVVLLLWLMTFVDVKEVLQKLVKNASLELMQ